MHFSWNAVFYSVISSLLILIFNYAIVFDSTFSLLTLYAFSLSSTAIAAIYGTFEGVICAAVYGLVYLTGLFIDTEQTFSADWPTLIPLTWLFTALIAGEIRLYFKEQEGNTAKELYTAQKKLDKLFEQQKQNRNRIQLLEREIKSSQYDLSATITTLCELITLKPSQILLRSEKAILHCLAPNKFSLYALGNNVIEAVVSHGWLDSDHYPLRFDSSTELYKRVILNKETLYNQHEEQKRILQNDGILAVPLQDGLTGDVFGLIKIEEMDLSLSTKGVEKLAQALSFFIGTAYGFSSFLQRALKEAVHAKEGGFYTLDFVKEFFTPLKALMDELGRPLFILSLVINKDDELFTINHLRHLHVVLKKLLPVFSWLCYRSERRHEITILLPSVQPEDLEEIQKKINQELKRQFPALEGNWALSRSNSL